MSFKAHTCVRAMDKAIKASSELQELLIKDLMKAKQDVERLSSGQKDGNFTAFKNAMEAQEQNINMVAKEYHELSEWLNKTFKPELLKYLEVQHGYKGN